MNVAVAMCGNLHWWRDFQTRLAYHSNAIEGSGLSFEGTCELLWGVGDDTPCGSLSFRDRCWAINHRRAVERAFANLDDELSVSLIRDVAIEISHDVGEIGGFRTTDVVIQGAGFVPPPAHEVGHQMMVAVYHNRGEGNGGDSFDREARFHIEFERIHPFEDGNGRTGRIIMCRELVRAGEAPAVIPVDCKQEYFGLIGDRDARGLAELLRQLSREEAKRMLGDG